MVSLENLQAPICPITLKVMIEPTFCTVDGHTYERWAIEKWVGAHHNSPITRDFADLSHLAPNREVLEATMTINALLEQLQTHRDHKIPYTELSIDNGPAIGTGAFKTVRKGTWKGIDVAIAFINNGIVDFEAQVLADLSKHSHLIRFYGQSVSPDGSQCIVFEYANGGSLTQYIEKLEDNGEYLSLSQKQYILCQISEGMTEIARQKYVHRDLAARNILVCGTSSIIDWQSMTGVSVKIADLGLARRLDSSYYSGSEGGAPLPIRWMSPESILKSRFSEKSDVFSFGVLAWELLSDGAVPWTNGLSNSEVSQLVVDGNRLPRPNECPDSLWTLLLSCWDEIPANRPSFQLITDYFNEHQIERLADVHIQNNSAATLNPGGITNQLSEVEKEVKILSDNGTINSQSGDRGRTPFIRAIIAQDVERVNALLRFGADIEGGNIGGVTPIICAAEYGHVEILQLLHRKGANVNHQQYQGVTALIMAADKGHVEIIKLLISFGADTSIRDSTQFGNGETALQYAQHNHHYECAEVLRAASR